MCGVVLASSLFIGNWFSLKLLRRSSNLVSVIEVINRIRTYISFGGYEIMRVVAESFASAPDFSAFTDYETSDDFQEWWKNCVSELSTTTALNNNDKELMLRFGAGLGVTDIQGQLANCDLYIGLFSECLDKSKEMERKNVKLYRILGFSMGCMVTLIML